MQNKKSFRVQFLDDYASLDTRVMRTRNKAVRAFLELFTEKNGNEVTIQDICERAKINRTTFYLNFNNYDGFTFYAGRMVTYNILQEIYESTKDIYDVEKRYRAIVGKVVEIIYEHLDIMRTAVIHDNDRRVYGCLSFLVLSALDDAFKLPREDSKAVAVKEMVAGAITGYIYASFSQERINSIRSITEELSDLLVPYLSFFRINLE